MSNAEPTNEELAPEAARACFDTTWWDSEAAQAEREQYIEEARLVLSGESGYDIDPDFRRDVLKYVEGVRRAGRVAPPPEQSDAPLKEEAAFWLKYEPAGPVRDAQFTAYLAGARREGRS